MHCLMLEIFPKQYAGNKKSAEHKEQINTGPKEMRPDITVKEVLTDYHQHCNTSQKINALVSCLLLHVTTRCQSKDPRFRQSNFFQVASHLVSKALNRHFEDIYK